MQNAEEIATNWMEQCCKTVKKHKHAEHMNLISKNVKAFGVKGHDVIQYKEWFAQCEQEFKDKLIEHVEYSKLKIRKTSDTQIMFLINEVIYCKDGAVYEQAVEVVLGKEEDAQWRVVQQRVLNKKEAMHFNLNQ